MSITDVAGVSRTGAGTVSVDLRRRMLTPEAGGEGERLIVVSNRVPAQRERSARAGGLAVALQEALNQYGGTWYGWSGEVTENPSAEPRRSVQGRVEYALLDLTADEHKNYYLDFANSTLWPLCHYRLGLIDFRRAAWEGYLAVNERFARVLAASLRPGDIIWVHDYHFLPLAAALRRLGVSNRIGFFLHVPFPVPEVLAVLPCHDQLVRNLCDYDLVGLQTKADVRALSEYIRHEAGGHVRNDGHARVFGRSLQIMDFPIGIDTEGFAELAGAEADSAATQGLRRSLAGRNLMLGVDRLDYSKGIPQRFQAFDLLLASRPEYRGTVTMMQIAPLSRDGVAEYRQLRKELDRQAGHINGKYAEFDWTPLRYLNRVFARSQLAGFYRIARVGLVTPLRDGMNLVAKEYVAAQDPEDPGVLVLSRFAGAAQELTGAITINPYDPEKLADAFDRALRMPLAERRRRWQENFTALQANRISDWGEAFIFALKTCRNLQAGGVAGQLAGGTA